MSQSPTAAPAAEPVTPPEGRGANPRGAEAAFAELNALFEGPLQGVSFPDISRAAFAELLEAVRAAGEDVATARAGLEQAQQALEAKHQLLHQRAQRALAYARVYAQDDDALAAQIALIKLPAPKAPKAAARPPSEVRPALNPDGTPAADAPRRRGRPPKVREVAAPVDEAVPPQH